MKPEQPEAHMRELGSFRPLRIRSDTWTILRLAGRAFI